MRTAPLLALALLGTAWAEEPLQTLEGRFVHAGAIRAARFLPDGALLALAADGIHEWEVPSGRERRRFPPLDVVGEPHFSADGKLLIQVGPKGLIVHDLSGRVVAHYEALDDEEILAISPDATFVGVHSETTDATFVVEVATGKHRLIPGGKRRGMLAIAPHGERIAYIDAWTATLIDERGSRTLDGEGIFGVVFSLDGSVLATLGDLLVRWDAKTHTVLSREVPTAFQSFRDLWSCPVARAWFPNPHLAITSSFVVKSDQLLQAPDFAARNDLFMVTEPARHLLWKDGHVVSVSLRGTAQWIDGKPFHLSASGIVPNDPIGRALFGVAVDPALAHDLQRWNALGAALSPDGRWLALARKDSVVLDWKRPSTWLSRVTRDPGTAVGVAWGPLIAFAKENSVDLFSMETGERVKSLGERAWSGLAFTSSGELVTFHESVLTLRSKDSYKVKARIPADHFAVGPRGLAVARGKTIVLERRVIETPSRVLALAFSPDGTKLASSHEDAAVRIWDALSSGEAPRSGR